MGFRSDAADFVANETPFHLGFLPTEQSSPLTRGLDEVFARSTAEGVRRLQRVDREVLKMAREVLAGAAFEQLVRAGTNALRQGRKLIFSGCGATGRLSILLESMWRHAGGGQVFSIMTGGDYALIRSVEFFEDYPSFGREQVRELDVAAGDVLVAITEGGETSSVLGTVTEATRRGAGAFLLFNNPAALLRERLERCREAIDNPSVTVLDLHCGPMAVAGSTRMQATTAEQLVAGAALEAMAVGLAGDGSQAPDFAAGFEDLLDSLESDAGVGFLAEAIEFEEDLYRRGGRVTYFADAFLLDIFTDTTERSPTFMLPPFRKCDDPDSPQSWAFVKNPRLDTPAAWHECLGRAPRCLRWTAADYRRMGAKPEIVAHPPRLDETELMKFTIGREDMPCRRDRPNAAVRIGGGAALEAAFRRQAAPYQDRRCWDPPLSPRPSKLNLLARLGLKLVLNTISTGTMARRGRLSGNWMSHVDVSNKKLIDRGTRLIAELAGLPYAEACTELFQSIERVHGRPGGAAKPSPVQDALRRLAGRPNGGAAAAES